MIHSAVKLLDEQKNMLSVGWGRPCSSVFLIAPNSSSVKADEKSVAMAGHGVKAPLKLLISTLKEDVTDKTAKHIVTNVKHTFRPLQGLSISSSSCNMCTLPSENVNLKNRIKY